MIKKWMHDKIWSEYRKPIEKYLNPQWADPKNPMNPNTLMHILSDPNDARSKLYTAIKELGEEADKMVPLDTSSHTVPSNGRDKSFLMQ
jgi:hypothetical protein